VSLLLFDSGMRRRGYGSSACTAVAAHLRRSSLVKRLIAEVAWDNHPSLCFWKKLGFQEMHVENGISTLVKDLHGDGA
jgi:RimJ/RimL family protein N-acetyltransferase